MMMLPSISLNIWNIFLMSLFTDSIIVSFPSLFLLVDFLLTGPYFVGSFACLYNFYWMLGIVNFTLLGAEF